MAEQAEDTQSEQPAQDPTPETARSEEETDWKAMARKWEKRAKENAAGAKANDELQANYDAISKSYTLAKSELLQYKQSEKKQQWANKVSKDTGIPAELLDADTEEGMRAQAERLAKYLTPRGLPGQGSTPGQTPRSLGDADFAHRLLSGNN